MRTSYEELFQTFRVTCHDCDSEITCGKGYDGMPIIQQGNHKLFYHIESGWFACCKITMQECRKGGRKSKLYHPCRW